MLKSSIIYIKYLNFDVRDKQVYINDSCKIIHVKLLSKKMRVYKTKYIL